MPKPVGWGRAARALTAGALLLAASCQTPGSQRIIGPDGSPMAHVHCGSDQGLCFRMAGELCPLGYDIKPVLSGHDGNFLVRCHAAKPASVVAASAPPAQPAAPPVNAALHSSAPRGDWPPAAEPSPAPYPWPSASASASARSQPTTPAAQGELDLGY